MEATKVRISEEVWALNKMTPKKKRKLREQAVLDLIRSKPNLEPISIREFAEVGRFNTEPTAWAFLKRMEKKGIIRKESRYGRGMAFSIPADTKVKNENDELTYPEGDGEITVGDVRPQPRKGYPAGTFKTLPTSADTIERYAKDFLWTKPMIWNMERDLLAEFVKFVRDQELKSQQRSSDE